MNKSQALLFIVALVSVTTIGVVTFTLLAPPSGKSYQFVCQTAYFHAQASSEFRSDTFTITGEQWYFRRQEYATGISAPNLIVEVHDAGTSEVIGSSTISSSNSIAYFTTKGTFYLTIKTNADPSPNVGQFTDSLEIYEYR